MDTEIKVIKETYPQYSDVVEISDETFSHLLDTLKATNDFKKHGRDGYITVWRKTYRYRGVPYVIALNRYYQLGDHISGIKGMNIHTRWFVLGCPEEDTRARDWYNQLYPVLEDKEFLDKTTLCSFYKYHTLEQMFYEMAKMAKKDIDMFLDTTEHEIDMQLSRLVQLKKEFKMFVGTS